MITKQLINGGTVWQIIGPGFYATYKANQSTGQPYLTRLGYVQNVQFPASQTEGVIISDVATLLQMTGIDISSTPERELEIFIRSLYVLGMEFDTTPDVFTLHEEMDGLGKLSVLPLPGTVNFYSSIAVFDFMAMTGAILYPFNRLVSGNIQSRPTVQNAPAGDKAVLWQVIEKVGIQGFLVNLLSEYGITEEEFTERLLIWKPDQQDRASFVYSYAIPHLRTKGWRILSSSEIVALIG